MAQTALTIDGRAGLNYKGGASGQPFVSNASATNNVWLTPDDNDLRVPVDVQEEIMMVDTNGSRFMTLLGVQEKNSRSMGLKTSRTVTNFQFWRQYEAPIEDRMYLTASFAAPLVGAAGVASTVDNGALCMVGMQAFVVGYDLNLIATIVSGNTVTFATLHGYAQTVPAGAMIQLGAVSISEAADPPGMIMRGTTGDFSYVGQTGLSEGWSLWEVLQKKRGITEPARLEKQWVRLFNRQRENNAIRSKAGTYTDSVTGNKGYVASGLIECISKYNTPSLANNLTYDTLIEAVQSIGNKRTSDDPYTCITSDVIMNAFTRLPEVRSKCRRVESDHTLGFEITEITGPGVTLHFVGHRLWNDNADLASTIACFQMSDMGRVTMAGGDMWFKRNIELPGSNRTQHVCYTIEGLECKNPWGAGLIKDVAA